ncbi:MAG: metallophosphoesterase [Chitinispirillales bacterium]|nr:metallophosphoesterase [Chitinispirillales bacterium]
MIFYIADLHLGHKNIIKFCERPFSSVEEMNKTFIENWNEVVDESDTVYIIGDFAYRSALSTKPVLEKLKGIKHLITGNHDRGWMKNIKPEEYFASVSPLAEIDDGDTHVILCHYPMLSWNRAAYGAVHIHGHIHNSIKGRTIAILKDMNAYNAGVDVNYFKPVTLEQLKVNKETFYKRYDTATKCLELTKTEESA